MPLAQGRELGAQHTAGRGPPRSAACPSQAPGPQPIREGGGQASGHQVGTEVVLAPKRTYHPTGEGLGPALFLVLGLSGLGISLQGAGP